MSAYPLPANGALCQPHQTEEYLSTLFRYVDWQSDQVISLLGVGEKGTPKEGVFRERKIVSPAFIGAAHAHIRRWAENHVASFIVPAVLHGAAAEANDATLDKVAALTAILLDLDNGDISGKAAFAVARLGPPTMIVASGGATAEGEVKRHLYWLLNEPSEEVERVAAVRKLLAQKIGGDPSFGRATQVIRLPGSVHAKNGTVNKCEILERIDVDYSLDDLADIIEAMEPMPGAEPGQAPLLLGAPGTGTMMDFTPRYDTAIEALHRDVTEGGTELTRFSEATKVFGFQIAEARAGRVSLGEAFAAAEGWMLQHMQPPWPAGRFRQEFEALVKLDVKNHGPFPEPSAVRHAANIGALSIDPSPASWPAAHTIPPRPWVFGKWLQRGIVTAMVAPGGVGKSSFVAAMTLSLASGEAILRKTVWGGAQRAWYWNLEDNGDNLARARIAASMHYGIGSAECGDRLFVDSGPDGAMLCTAVEDRVGFTIIEPVMQALCEAIRARGIDVLIVDPFVSSHAVNENDNNKIDAVAKAWARVAQVSNCAIVLVHHSTKLRGEKVTAESSRGAGALNNAARMTLVLNRMSPEQADGWGIDPVSAMRYFNVSDDKHNLSAAEAADWFQLVSVNLNNATDVLPSDDIGVVTPWEPPKIMDGVEVNHLFQIQKVLNAGTYWRSEQSRADWAGDVVGNVIGIDTVEKASKKRISAMLNVWIASGALKSDMRRDEEKRKMRECVVVGNWAAPPAVFHGGGD